jgi:hypothetical protein
MTQTTHRLGPFSPSEPATLIIIFPTLLALSRYLVAFVVAVAAVAAAAAVAVTVLAVVVVA